MRLTPISGWLASTAAFPQRALVLASRNRRGLTRAGVDVAENGTAVDRLTLTPVTRPGAGDFSLVVVIDRSSSMRGAGLATAISAVQDLVANQPANEKLGVVTFDAAPTTEVSPTTNTLAIGNQLAVTPSTGPGADVPAATSSALGLVRRAQTAMGAVVVISDGVGLAAPGRGPSASSVGAAAAADHVPVVTIGLRDAHAGAASLQALSLQAPGRFLTATPARLSGALAASVQRLGRSHYVVRYRSEAGRRSLVNVTASAAGLPGIVDASYRSPGPPPRLILARRAVTVVAARGPPGAWRAALGRP